MYNKTGFFKEAIKSIKTSGTLIPSSRFLVKSMLYDIDFKKPTIIVEFGPGNGVITHKILDKMHENALLICFEINPKFNDYLKNIDDKRLIVLNESAENIIKELIKLNITEIDYCVSSLPLTNIPNIIGENIIKNAHKIIKNNGFMYQFQYSLSFLKKFKNTFKDKNVKIKFEALNFPPAFIYKCKKA